MRSAPETIMRSSNGGEGAARDSSVLRAELRWPDWRNGGRGVAWLGRIARSAVPGTLGHGRRGGRRRVRMLNRRWGAQAFKHPNPEAQSPACLRLPPFTARSGGTTCRALLDRTAAQPSRLSPGAVVARSDGRRRVTSSILPRLDRAAFCRIFLRGERGGGRGTERS